MNYKKKKLNTKLVIILFIMFLLIFITFNKSANKKVMPIIKDISSSFLTVLRFPINIIDSYQSKNALKEENAKLLKENTKLNIELNKYNELESEINLLKQMLDIKNDSKYKISIGKVIERNTTTWDKYLKIDLGDEKVNLGDTVILRDMFLGKIIEVNKTFSYVEIINNDFPKITFEHDNAFAYFEQFNNENIILKTFKTNPNLEIGDVFYTSSLNKDIIPNIELGTIKEIRKDNYGIYNEIIIGAKYDLNNIKYVLVVGETK